MNDDPMIQRSRLLNADLVDWNNRMFHKHPTPYRGVAGFIEWSRVRAVLKFAGVKPDDTVLEIGCEAGHLLIHCPPAKRIVGGDISSTALRCACRQFEAEARSAEFFHLDAQEALPFSPGEFSVIICSEVLEHVNRPGDVLGNIHRLAGPDTRIIISIPTERPKILVKKALRVLGLFRLLFPGIEKEHSEWHLQVFSKKKLLGLSDSLFRVRKSRWIWLNHYVALMNRKDCR